MSKIDNPDLAVMHRILIISLMWLLAIAAAFFVGRRWAGESDTMPRPTDPETPPSLFSVYRTGSDHLPATSDKDEFAWINQAGPLSESAMRRAIKGVMAVDDFVERDLLYVTLFKKLTASNAPAALDELLIRPDIFLAKEGTNVMLFAAAWGKIDGKAAVERISQSSGGTLGNIMLSQAAKAFALTDPEEAASWLEPREETEAYWARSDHDNLLPNAILSGLAEVDLARATDLAVVMNEMDTYDRFIQIVAIEAANKGLKAFSEWVDRLPTDDLKRSALFTSERDLVRQDLAAAAEWVKELLAGGNNEGSEWSKAVTDPSYVNGLAGTVTEYILADGAPHGTRSTSTQVSQEARNNALVWAEELPSDDARRSALSRIMRQWGGQHPEMPGAHRDGAGAYLEQMPEGRERDELVRELCAGTYHVDPRVAVAWAESISQESYRNPVFVYSGRAWLEKDPIAASEWLESANLPEEIVEQIKKTQ